MGSSTLQCAYSQCEERFPPKTLAPRKRFHSQRCRTKARTERLIKQGQADILKEMMQGKSYQLNVRVMNRWTQLLNELDQ